MHEARIAEISKILRDWLSTNNWPAPSPKSVKQAAVSLFGPLEMLTHYAKAKKDEHTKFKNLKDALQTVSTSAPEIAEGLRQALPYACRLTQPQEMAEAAYVIGCLLGAGKVAKDLLDHPISPFHVQSGRWCAEWQQWAPDIVEHVQAFLKEVKPRKGGYGSSGRDSPAIKLSLDLMHKCANSGATITAEGLTKALARRRKSRDKTT